MAVAFRSISNTTYASRTDTTITAPSGITDGDQLLFAILTGASGTPPTPTPPGGLTQIGSTSTVTMSGFDVKLSIYRKTASSESGSYTFTHSACSSQGVALCYSGVDTSTPQDATATYNFDQSGGGASQTSTATGLTTVTDGAMLVMFEHDYGDNAPASTPPTGMTERLDVSIMYVADEIKTTAGATGNKSLTNSNNAGNAWQAFLVALRPASAPTGTATPAAIATSAVLPAAAATGNLPQYIQGQNAAISASRSPSVTFSAGVQTGDIVYFYCSTSTASSAATAPSGWVNVLATSTTIVTSDANTCVGVYHIVTSGENGSTTFTATNLFDSSATGNVLAAVIRNVDTTTPVDNSGSTFSSTNTVTPHVLAAITGTGSALSANSLVVSGVSKDTTGSHTTPGTHTQVQTSNSTSATWLGLHNTFTTANTNVTAVNITPSAGDEYCSISVAFTVAATGGATAAPAVIARSVAVEAATPQAGTTTSPAVVARTVTLPAPTVGAAATATPAAIATSVALPAATPQASYTITPAVLALAVTVPAPVIGNPIPAENALTGYDVANWQVSGIGDTAAFGFTTTMSVAAGDDIDFKIHSSGDPYDLEIVRLGWYGGDGARLIDTIPNTGETQSEGVRHDPFGESGVGSRDCSNWTVTDTWSVPSDAVHGVYLGVIKRDGESVWAHVGPFVVRTTYSDTQAAIVAKLSDMTWRAYNTFGTLAAPTGGKSLYGSGSSGNIDQANRAWDVSYDAPLIVASGVPQTSYWNGEQPVHAFLERNGFDVAYVSCLDVDTEPELLLGRSVIMSIGHDEYWTQNVRDAWDAAIDSGVHAVVMSGNTMLWRTRMDGRRMYCYKDSHSLDTLGTGEDPVTWTGTWRDLRWASRRPENESIGTMFVANGIRVDEIVLRATHAAEPLWRDTTAAALTGGTTETLKADCLGFEWDSYEPDYVNSMGYPPGLKLLSLTAIDLTGNSANENGSIYNLSINPANHHIVAFQRGASTTVNFGTNQWGWGLSDLHVRGATGENTTMKQATINLFADLGCQPETIQSGLSVADDELDTWSWPTATALSLPATASIAEAETEQLAATTTWTNSITTDTADYATWDSTNDAVATVSTTGLVTGVAAGTATISATYDGESDTCVVTVTAASAYDHVWTGSDPTGITDSGTYELGTWFTVSENTTLVGIRIWNPGLVDPTGNRIATLWTHNGSGASEVSQRTIDIPDVMDSGWSEHLFSSTSPATTSVNYCVSYWAAGDGTGGGQDYGAVAGGLASAMTTGPVTYPIDGGRYYAGGTAGTNCPDTEFGSAFYGVDVLYETGGVDGTATPAVIARSISVPSATPQASGSVTAPVTALTIALSAVTAQAGTTTLPATIARTVDLPAAAPSGGGSSTAAPTVIPLAVTIPAVTPQAGTTTDPTVIPLTVAVPTPTPLAGTTTTPTVIPLTVTLPAVSASGASEGTVTPAVITTTVTLPAPTPKASWTVTPAVTTLTVTMPVVTAGGSMTITPAVIPLTVNVRTATAAGGTAGTALPAVTALLTVIPNPTNLYGYVVNPQAIALAVTIAAAIGTGIIPDAHPITVTMRDTGHTITVRTTGTTTTVRTTGTTATVRENA